MNISLFYLAGIIILFYIHMSIDRELRREFLSREGKKNPAVIGWLFFALFAPRLYFKKEKFWEGYGLYLVNILVAVAIVYLIVLLIP